MDGFFKSFLPFFEENKITVVFAAFVFIIALVSLSIYVKSSQQFDKHNKDISFQTKSDKINETNIQSESSIMIEVSGAVKKPNVYKMSSRSRLKDVIDRAGGLSDAADQAFFARNFNLARFVSDQEKIHVPSNDEIESGIYVENARLVDYTQPQIVAALQKPQTTSTDQNSVAATSTSININTATSEELDTLPGIGQVTADKIIQGRPYASISELVDKKILKKNVFEQVQSQIGVY